MDTHPRRSIFWPLLLITIGAVFLLNTLGFIQGDGWDYLLKLWPLLFIIGGLDNIFQGRGYIWAVISLGLGAVFLLANFGYIEWSSFSLLLRFWPLLLIAAGLDLIFRGRSLLTTLIGVALAVVVVGSIIWFALSGAAAVAQEATPLSQALGDAQSLNVHLSNPAGQVEVGAVEDAGKAYEGSITLASRQSPQQRYEVRNGVGDLRITSAGNAFLPWTGGFDRPLWQVDLSDQVPVTLTVNTAAGEQQIDLTGLDVQSLDLTVAVGELNVTLPEQGEFNGKLANPVGMIRVSVPPGALVEFHTNGVFLSKSVPAGFTVSGENIYSPGSNKANAEMRITIDQSIGRLVILEAP